MRRVTAAVLAGALMFSLAGCSGAAENKGENTTCGDYLELETAQQVDVIKKAAEQSGDKLEGSEDDMKLFASLLADMCKEADANTKIKDL